MLTYRLWKTHSNPGSLNQGGFPLSPLWKVLIFLKDLWSKSYRAWNLIPAIWKIQVESPVLLGNFGWVTQLLGLFLAKQSQDFAFSFHNSLLLPIEIQNVWGLEDAVLDGPSLFCCGRTSHGHPSSILQREKMCLYPTCCFRWDKQAKFLFA